jgi:glycosyltransferase involved in cell wall biosynthesis
MDNYVFLYVVAARLVQPVPPGEVSCFVYLDGKHLIDRGWPRFLSGLAEAWGRPLVESRGHFIEPHSAGQTAAGFDAQGTGSPGFLPDELQALTRPSDSEVRFLYSGALDTTRGVDLLLEALELLPEHGWHLDITGYGALTDRVSRFAQDLRCDGKVKYHHSLPPEAYQEVVQAAHVGLNCQRASELISSVTFPSKVFTYLSAGLLVISSKAGCVEQICGNACFYYEGETPVALAAAMKGVIENFAAVRQKLNPSALCKSYSFHAATTRIRQMLKTIGW